MKTIAYLRVSTEDQARHGVSLEDQQKKILQYAELYNFDIIEVISDPGYSAKTMKRPGMEKVFSMMKRKECDAVIVSKLDRLTRSVRDLADIIDLANKKDISLVSVNEHIDTGTAAGRMIVNMLAVISQWERETIGERTASALQFKKESGKVYNHCPYGYRREEDNLVRDDSEQKVISFVMLMQNKNRVSEICRLLTEKGFTPRNGYRWHNKVVRKIIDDDHMRQSIDSNISVYKDSVSLAA